MICPGVELYTGSSKMIAMVVAIIETEIFTAIGKLCPGVGKNRGNNDESSEFGKKIM